MGQEISAAVMQVKNLTKRFGPLIANDNISLELHPGEIHCLLGENGAGKSTLASCLYGSYKPDSGGVFIGDDEVDLNSPRDAIKFGVGLVHQHFVLVPALTVIENVIVGTISSGIKYDVKKAKREIQSVCEAYEIDIDLNAKVWQLSVGEQQWVEILKVLYVGVKLLILDEPTASLTLPETVKLFSILKKMKAENLSIVLITHKLREVMEIADKVTVLRKGKLIATVPRSKVTEKDLAEMMVGREVVLQISKDTIEPGGELLQIRNLRVENDKGKEAIKNISLILREKEILGIAGVSGNGQRELFEAIIGVRKSIAGQILVNDTDITRHSPREIMKHGIAHIPEDRIHEGLLTDFSVKENLILGYQRKPDFCKGLFMDAERIAGYAQECVKSFGIDTPSIEHPARFLSGGNLQRIILAREFSAKPRCIIANQPTRGLDVAACEYVYHLLLEERRCGAGILLFSEDLQELLGLADRIGVIYEGQILDLFAADEVELEQVGLLMGGVQE